MNTGPNAADNAESLAVNVILACALAPPFALVFVVLRFYTARRILRAIHADDFTQHGLGYHLKYLKGPHVGLVNLRMFMLLSVLPIAITGNLATLFIKTSILRFYLRFTTSCRFTVAVYIVMSMVIVANSLGALGFLFSCRPISYSWDYFALRGKGSCIAMDPWYGWLVIFNCVTDGVLLALPAWIIYPLRVGLAQKAALAAILGTGGFILGVSILRVVIVSYGWGDQDFTYKFATNFIWSIIEINVGIACACAPCLKAFAGRYIPSLRLGGGKDGVVDLYTLPTSQVARRLPGTPAGANDNDAGSNKLRCVGSGWHSKMFSSDTTVATGDSGGSEQRAAGSGR
ncbi:hypothetical protein C8A00DRAFT_46473 [Chaetomidium leptoderma]|uniref:Rhodopsin domain-containing protein n=1 Tax=Chaetomidium leptoderma TaxID=669021 RepID=A0AAN6VEX0_9PEZI|nr:hypothetical protein C8A00DRAFT_46473 [Chaetomidium leptoderma]